MTAATAPSAAARQDAMSLIRKRSLGRLGATASFLIHQWLTLCRPRPRAPHHSLQRDPSHPIVPQPLRPVSAMATIDDACVRAPRACERTVCFGGVARCRHHGAVGSAIADEHQVQRMPLQGRGRWVHHPAAAASRRKTIGARRHPRGALMTCTVGHPLRWPNPARLLAQLQCMGGPPSMAVLRVRGRCGGSGNRQPLSCVAHWRAQVGASAADI